MQTDMEILLNIADFEFDEDKQTIFGVLYYNDPTLLSYRIKVKDHPNVEGFVFEYFQTWEETVNSIILGKPLGTFFGRIAIEKGWEILKSHDNIPFSLVPYEKTTDDTSEPNGEVEPGQIYIKYRRMNRPHELSSFYIDVRGGSTDGAGRNEHGAPHFHILKKNTRQDLGKIEIPSATLWKKTKDKMSLINTADKTLTKSEKKELIDWLKKGNNLQRLLDEWNESNKYNNRTPSTTA